MVRYWQDIEIGIYRKKLISVISVENVVGIIMGYYGFEVFTAVIAVSFLVCLGLVCFGKVEILKNKWELGKERMGLYEGKKYIIISNIIYLNGSNCKFCC